MTRIQHYLLIIAIVSLSACRPPVRPRDTQPPSIQTTINTSGGKWIEPHQQPRYIVAPATVTFNVTALDAIDGPTPVTCQHNGVTVQLPLTISARGLHTLEFTATDKSGNQEFSGFQFEIRDALGVQPAITVPAIKYRQRDDGRTIADLYVRVDKSTLNLPWEHVYVHASTLFGTDERMNWITNGAPIRGITYEPVEGMPNHVRPVAGADLLDIREDETTWTARYELVLDESHTEIAGVNLMIRSLSIADEPFEIDSTCLIQQEVRGRAHDAQPLTLPAN